MIQGMGFKGSIVHKNEVLLTRLTVSSHLTLLLRLSGTIGTLFHFNKGMKLN